MPEVRSSLTRDPERSNFSEQWPYRVVGSPQGLLRWGSHRSGRAELPHPAPQVKLSLGDGRYYERRAPAVKESVARTPRTEPTAAWHWNGGVTTCARYVRRDAGSSPASVHSQSSRNTHNDRAACGSVAHVATSPGHDDVADTRLQWFAMHDSTDPSPSYAAPPIGLSESAPNTG